jgi:CsoR family transcriptional regulator, copper-sensing transcriptional repressor
MKFERESSEDIIKRLRRVEGQVAGVIRMLEQHRDCADIVTQLSAAGHALDRAGFKLLATGMRQCVLPAVEGGEPPMRLDEMERLFLSLS